MFKFIQSSLVTRVSLSAVVAIQAGAGALPTPAPIAAVRAETGDTTKELVITAPVRETIIAPGNSSIKSVIPFKSESLVIDGEVIDTDVVIPPPLKVAPVKKAPEKSVTSKSGTRLKESQQKTKSSVRMASEEDTDNAINDEVLAAKQVKLVTVTAYSSTKDQTDNSPCTTANGYNVCKANEENVVAVNGLPFGTKVRFPDHFGDRVFTVQDRMNPRYKDRMDVWMKSREAALKFGVKRLKAEIL